LLFLASIAREVSRVSWRLGVRGGVCTQSASTGRALTGADGSGKYSISPWFAVDKADGVGFPYFLPDEDIPTGTCL